MGYFDSIKHKPTPAPPPVGATVTPIRPATDGLHPYAARVIEAELARLDAARTAPLGHPPHWDETTYEVACNLLEIANSPWSGYTHNQARGDLDTRAPRDAGFDQRRIDAKWASAEQKVGATGRPRPTDTHLDPPPVTVLDVPDLDPDAEHDFWHAREILRHLHDFARARRVSPWAVLGVTLARMVTATPWGVCLPPIVGGKASLNTFIGLVGPSGSGKGAAEAVAADAVQVGYITTHNVGSGEGIAHGYMRRHKGNLEWLDDTHAVLFSVPEIDSLAAQGDRKGATLMPQLRSGWTGEQLGFGYADPTKRIIVPAHEYRLCLVAGIQPGRAACLLDDADGGTPQRFLWLPATDPHAPDQPPTEPPPWRWEPPKVSDIVSVGGTYIDVCQTARDTIVAARLARLRGDGDALDGHALLAQLKTAAALGIADGRYTVTDDDWHLAELVARKSAAIRAAVQGTLKARAVEANVARADAEAKRVVHVAETVTEVAVKRVCGVIVRKLGREGDWVPRGQVRIAVASRDREHFDEALERLLDAATIEVDDTATGHGNTAGKYRLKERS